MLVSIPGVHDLADRLILSQASLQSEHLIRLDDDACRGIDFVSNEIGSSIREVWRASIRVDR